MTTSLFEIDQKEIKNRKQWLIATIVCWGSYPLLALFFLAKLPQKPPLYNGGWIQPVTYVLFNVTLFWVIWHCAYKKPGTKLLMFWLITGPIQVLLSSLNFFEKSWNVWNKVGLILNLSFFIWWYIQSIKLRKINKKIQIQKYPEYIKSLQLLNEMTSREKLDEEFSKLIRNWPQFERTSSKEYKLKKDCLSRKVE